MPRIFVPLRKHRQNRSAHTGNRADKGEKLHTDKNEWIYKQSNATISAYLPLKMAVTSPPWKRVPAADPF